MHAGDTKFYIFRRDGEWWGEDEHGEYRINAGATEKPDPSDYSYQPCGAVLKYTYERYGEKRYCEGMAVGNFGDTDYEHDDYCKHHQSRQKLMDQHAENFVTGAWVQAYDDIFQYLAPHKKALAIEYLESLFEESTYEFDATHVDRNIDTSESDLVGVDEIVMEQPVPTANKVRGKALWYAALDFIRIENILEEQFRTAHEQTFDGGEVESPRDVAVGERVQVVGVSDESGAITDVGEHHLNLPLSRIEKDYERHMEFGGITLDEDEEAADMSGREWVMTVRPETPEPDPMDGAAPMDAIEMPEEA